jgi:hypothetical protein
VGIQDQKTHGCPCGPMHAHDEPTTACQTARAQHSRPQHLARTSLPSCSTFSRCPHIKRCTQLVASSATWHLRARPTLLQTNNQTGIHACSKQLPNNKIQQLRRRQTATLRAAVSYLKTRAQEDATHVGAAGTESASWRCLLTVWMMLLRDNNCSAIRHSEEVSIHE